MRQAMPRRRAAPAPAATAVRHRRRSPGARPSTNPPAFCALQCDDLRLKMTAVEQRLADAQASGTACSTEVEDLRTKLQMVRRCAAPVGAGLCSSFMAAALFYCCLPM